MPKSNTQQKLEETYDRWKAGLKIDSGEASHISPPLLLSVTDSFEKAQRRILFVGQETYGWDWDKDLRKRFPDYPSDYPYEDTRNMHDFLNQPQSVEALCWGYREFAFARSQPITQRSPFWRAFRELQAWPQSEVLWNNVSRCDYEGGSILSAPQNLQENLGEQQFNLFSQELEILSPNICLFFCGPNYDASLSRIFPQLEYISIGTVPIREFSRLSHPNLPALSFRTYHPNYLSRSERWGIISQIREIVLDGS